MPVDYSELMALSLFLLLLAALVAGCSAVALKLEGYDDKAWSCLADAAAAVLMLAYFNSWMP